MEAVPPSPASIEEYLRSMPRWVRWRQWVSGRRYRIARFSDRATPLVIIAHPFRDAANARQVALAVEQDWPAVPQACRDVYDEILFKAPELIVIQLRRKNVCGCLGHRHVAVRESPFAEPHEAFSGARVGEMDIAYERVETWSALPLSDTALDVKFLDGSRLSDFRAKQFRLKLLSILLHETNHLVASTEPEGSVRARSLAFYRDALAAYVEETISTMSFTIDRSFSRLGE
ncbi:MAG: hypothetical protein ACE145_11405 [Terriglobia bacterium]